MARIRQSFCYPCFRKEGQSLDELFALAAEIGYPATELWGWDESLDEIAATAKKHGLAIASICGHGTLEDGLNKVENHDRIEAELIRSIDKAAEWGIPGVICFPGNRNPGQSDLDGLVACAKGLRRVIGQAERKGVNLNVELLNSKVDHPGYQADHPDWGIALCEMVGSERAKLLFDIYHMQIMTGDVIRYLRKAMPYIGHMHTAGNPGRKDLDDTQEMNYVGICRAIAAAGYGYFMGHELFPKGDRAEALRHTFTVCDQQA